MAEEKKAKKKKSKISQLKEELKKKEEEIKDSFDKYLRALAELENFKKRVAKEKEGVWAYANERVISDLLPILDNFERALDSGKNSKEFDAFYQGVELIYRQLKEALEKEGLRDFSSKGEIFDPSKHEAIAAVEWEDSPPDTVVEEVQKGYYLKDRLLRPARVMVSKAKTEEEEKEESET